MSAPLARISVAMCTYNGAPHLREQLSSIATQTLLPTELVVADDCSRDSTIDIIEDFAQHAPFPVRFILNSENLGSTKNFEQVIGLCSGELIALSDQDDIWYPEKLARLAGVFASDPKIGGVFSDGMMIDGNSRPIGKTLWQAFGFKRRLRRQWRHGNPTDILFRQEIVTGATLAFRQGSRNLILPISKRWVHDAWIAWIVASTATLAFVEEPLICYRVHSAQQEGVPALTLAAAISRTVRHRAADQRRTAEAFQDLRDHLQHMLRDSTILENIAFDEKISLCSKRSNLFKHRAQRLKQVLSLTPAYLRYSRGFQEALKDILWG